MPELERKLWNERAMCPVERQAMTQGSFSTKPLTLKLSNLNQKPKEKATQSHERGVGTVGSPSRSLTLSNLRQYEDASTPRRVPNLQHHFETSRL